MVNVDDSKATGVFSDKDFMSFSFKKTALKYFSRTSEFALNYEPDTLNAIVAQVSANIHNLSNFQNRDQRIVQHAWIILGIRYSKRLNIQQRCKIHTKALWKS